MTTGPIHYLSDVPRRDKTNRKTVCKGLAKYNVKIPKTSNLIRTQHSNSFSKVLRLFLRSQSQSQKPWLWIAPRPNSPTSLTGLARPVRRKNRSQIRRTRTFPTATGSKTLRFPFHSIIIIFFIVFPQFFKPIKIYLCLCVFVGICF